MKKKSSQKRKPTGIQNPDHPFHSFAKKKQVPKKSRTEDPKKLKGPKRKSQGNFKNTPVRQNADRAPVTSTEILPLNKFLAHTGLCARRKAAEYIKAGDVSVNGIIVEEPGFKVSDKDIVQYKGKKLFLQREPVYVLLNKPKGYITTTHDPLERKTVMELVARATDERIYPIGRLDRNTSGLLLLTNDGELAQELAHPANNVKKLYHVTLDKGLTKHHFEKIIAGIELEDGVARVDALAYEDPDDKKQIGIEIHSGRNRIVRRIFEHLGYEVKALDRVIYAGLTKKNLPRGKWRMLTPREVVLLKHLNGGRKGGGRQQEAGSESPYR